MKRFTFHNSGSITTFNPSRDMGGEKALDFYKGLVSTSGRKDVYIVDHKGRDVDCTSSPTKVH